MKRTIGKFAAFLLALGVVFNPSSPAVAAKGTPDNLPPAVEDVCTHWKDSAQLGSKPYGLCVSYCEAQDCDEHPERPSCEQLLLNLRKVTGDPEAQFPCSSGNGGVD
jgi:hypothetical protein